MKVTSIDSHTSAALNCIRWMAAMAVVLHHINDKMFIQWAEISEPNRSVAAWIWKTISASGHEAVIVFFVISGYLVGGGALKEFLERGDLRLSNYLLRRCTRLYIVLIPALILGGFLDISGSLIADDSDLYADRMHHLNTTTFLGNMLFMQRIFVETFGTNDALWSLTNEFFYYITWGIFLFSLSKNRSTAQRLSLFAINALLCWLIYPKILLFGTFWLLGILVRIAEPKRSLPTSTAVLQFICAILAIRFFVPWELRENLGVYFSVSLVAAISTALLILSFQNKNASNGKLMNAFIGLPIHRRMADISYTLYATHYPVIFISIALLESRLGIGSKLAFTGFSDYILALAVLCITLLIAVTMYSLFEAKTESLYRYLATFGAHYQRIMLNTQTWLKGRRRPSSGQL